MPNELVVVELSTAAKGSTSSSGSMAVPRLVEVTANGGCAASRCAIAPYAPRL